jgi:hypothetical protein
MLADDEYEKTKLVVLSYITTGRMLWDPIKGLDKVWTWENGVLVSEEIVPNGNPIQFLPLSFQ